MSIAIRTLLVFAGLAVAWTAPSGRAGLRYAALAVASVGLALQAAECIKSRGATKAASGPCKEVKADPDLRSFLAALRDESDIVASSFEEDALLLTVLAQLDHGSFGDAVKTVKTSLGCDSKDAGLLARAVDRAARRVRDRSSPRNQRLSGEE